MTDAGKKQRRNKMTKELDVFDDALRETKFDWSRTTEEFFDTFPYGTAFEIEVMEQIDKYIRKNVKWWDRLIHGQSYLPPGSDEAFNAILKDAVKKYRK